MATWNRVNGDPITTESRVLVYRPDTGAKGFVAVRQPQPGRTELYGAVYTVDTDYDAEGTPTAERTEVIDADPTFAR